MIMNMNKYDILIESDRIAIVKMDTSMYFDVHKNSLDEDNRKFVPDEVFETVEDAKEVVDYLISCYQGDEGPFVYAIIRKSDDTNIGYIQLINIGENWEIGYHIAKIFTNNGYATEAVKLFLTYLKRTNLKEIYGIALSANKSSRRVLEKCGFKLIFEGMGPYQGKRRKIIKTVKEI